MARNGSGTYTVPNSFTAGTSITAAPHNQNWADAGAEITNSLALDGQSTMNGQFKAASGTAAAPGMAFGSDLDSGFYRIGSDNIGAAVGGSKVLDIASTGLGVTGSLDATTVKQGGFQLIPPGVGMDYWGSSAPDGWLLCYGQAISRTTYSALFTAIGTTYGTGDGSTTFNLPDKRGRVTAGKDDMGGSSANRLTNQSGGLNGDTLGATGGAETHTLALSETPAHDHGGGAHIHTVPALQNGSNDAGSGTTRKTNIESGTTDTSSSGAIITSQGGGGAHNNVQPTIVANYIIKY